MLDNTDEDLLMALEEEVEMPARKEVLRTPIKVDPIESFNKKEP